MITHGGDTTSSTTLDSCTRGSNGEPCRQHALRAKKKYQSRLEALGCICRALIALGQESCCSPARPLSLHWELSSSRSSVKSCTSSDSCCASKKPIPSSVRELADKEASLRTDAKRLACNDTCCGTSKAESICTKDEERSRSVDGCCPPKVTAETSTSKAAKPTCGDACCDVQKVDTIDHVKIPESHVRPVSDVELGLTGKEHVVLSISGMTCTGCETKLSRTLAILPSVSRLKTSLVLSCAEFELDSSLGSVTEVIKHLEKTTEFKCEQITNRGSTLDLICTGDATNLVKGDWPQGVIEVKYLGKRTVRVDFDPKVVGSRDLVQKGWSNPMELAPPSADHSLKSGAKHVRNMGLITLISILLTIPVLVLAWAPLPNKKQNEVTFGAISLAFATVIQIFIAGPFYPKALKALVFSRVIEMDLLIVLSTSAAYVFSVVAFGYLVRDQPLATGEFFETSTLLVTLIMVGRFVAAAARQKAVESISIRSLQSSSATLISLGDGVIEQNIDSRLLQYGDVFKVGPESCVPTDGTVITGASEVDESMLTGESNPVEKSEGSSVIAGSVNGSGVLTVRLTRIPGDNTISTIANMVDEAKLSKPKIQELADRIATFFVPIIISITVIVFCIWLAIGIAVQKKPASEATVQAITYAISVLIVSCPCAIGLAVPMVIVVATGVAAEKGVIFKSANAIEIAWKTSHVVFDKTGTLTQGKLRVARSEYLDTENDGKSLLLGLIADSKHPIAVAVAKHLEDEGVAAEVVHEPKNLVGRGIEGTSAGRTLRAGNSRWLDLGDDPLVKSILAQEHTAFCFTIDGEILAAFGLEDSLRSDAISTIAQLKAKDITIHVLSGDDDGAVSAVTTQLGIPAANVRSRCTPADKQKYVKELLDNPTSSKKPVVMFCGDGTNDAVALAQASIGVHMNEGTHVAKSAADIVLMRPTLAGVLVAIAVSQKSIHRIGFNFGWSFVYNVFAILLAAGAFVHARIPPEYAGLGELVSVLPVIAVGVTLKVATIKTG